MAKLHIIYVPGLGDQMPGAQRRAIGFWRLFGVTPELFRMNWADDVKWETKFSRLLKRIDELHDNNQAVALVGASAGGSAVINAFTARKDKLVGAVCIAGKIKRPEAIGPKYRQQNPSFVESAYACHEALKTLTKQDRQKIMSRYAIFDETVWVRDSYIENATNRTVWSVGHVPTIALQITIASHNWIRWLKRRPN